MQKATNESPEKKEDRKPEISPESYEKWSLGSFEPSSVVESASLGKKLQSIDVIARRSYGGANSYVEQTMSALEKSRKRSRKSIGSN
jgi:hypothetical protein